MVLGKLLVPGRPTIWITVGQGLTALTVLSSFTLSLRDGPIETLSQRAVKPKTTNQRSHNASHQVSKSSAFWLWKRRFLRFLPCVGVATIFMWPRTTYSPEPWRLHMKFGCNRPSGFREVIRKCDGRQRSLPIL